MSGTWAVSFLTWWICSPFVVRAFVCIFVLWLDCLHPSWNVNWNMHSMKTRRASSLNKDPQCRVAPGLGEFAIVCTCLVVLDSGCILCHHFSPFVTQRVFIKSRCQNNGSIHSMKNREERKRTIDGRTTTLEQIHQVTAERIQLSRVHQAEPRHDC